MATTSVWDSNSFGVPVNLGSAWSERQETAERLQEVRLQEAAAARAAAADAPPMMVRLAATRGVLLTELRPGGRMDGAVLARGDVVLLVAQMARLENGPWIVGDTAQRPEGYLAAVGRQFFVLQGSECRGALFVCTTASATAGATFVAVAGPPALRDGAAEAAYISGLAVRATTLAPPATPDEAAINRTHIGLALGVGGRSVVRAAVQSQDEPPHHSSVFGFDDGVSFCRGCRAPTGG